jgi:hypothetical protein
MTAPRKPTGTSLSVHLPLELSPFFFVLSAKRISLYLTATDFVNSVGVWHLQGMVFSPIPFQPDALPPIREPPGAEQPESSEDVPAASVTSTMSEFFRRMIFPPQEVSWITVSELLYFYSNVAQVSFYPPTETCTPKPFLCALKGWQDFIYLLVKKSLNALPVSHFSTVSVHDYILVQ